MELNESFETLLRWKPDEKLTIMPNGLTGQGDDILSEWRKQRRLECITAKPVKHDFIVPKIPEPVVPVTLNSSCQTESMKTKSKYTQMRHRKFSSRQSQTEKSRTCSIQTQTDSGFDISHVVDQLLTDDTVVTTETQKEPTDKELEDNYR